jgi:hypothetical protein
MLREIEPIKPEPSIRPFSVRSRGRAERSISTTSTVRFDLEGIGTDGLGYTVSITTGPNTTRGRSRIDLSGNGSFSFIRPMSSRVASFFKRENTAKSTPDDPNEKRIEINTRKSLEIRESFHENSDSEEIHIWKPVDEKEMEAGIERASVGLDLSILADLPHSDEDNLPNLDEVEQIPSALPRSRGRSFRARERPLSPITRVKHTQTPSTSSWLSSPPPRTTPSPTQPVNSSQTWAVPLSRRTSVLSGTSVDNPIDESFMLDMVRSAPEGRGRHDGHSMMATDGSRSSSSANLNAGNDQK